MCKLIILALALVTVCHGSKESGLSEYHIEDPFAMLNKHFSHVNAHHYLWPWSQLMKATAALVENLEEPKIVRSPDKLQVHLNVKLFKPEDLKIKVKNGYIFVEGKRKETNEDYEHFFDNHFTHRFVLPAGSKSEEVNALYNENGVLVISVPKHPLPPPPPEREVPIVVVLKPTPAVEEDSSSQEESSTEKKTEEPSSPSTPAEDLEIVEATTHLGKIRKKELKNTTKKTKDNEVTKGIDGNGLDYLLIETDE